MKKWKTISAIVLALAMVLSLSACGGPKESAQEVVTKGIEAVKAMDKAKIATYWGADTFKDLDTSETTATSAVPSTAAPTATPSAEDTAKYEAMIKPIFTGITYKIISSTEDVKAETATVSAEITNTDMNIIMSEFVKQAVSAALAAAFSGNQMTEEESDKLFTDTFTTLMAREDNTKVTKTVNIDLKLVDNAWKIVPSDEVVDAMLGGINSFTDALNGAMNGSTDDDSPKSKISEIRNWVVSDIWNSGICDMSSYYSTGKSCTGETMDAEFTISQLAKAMEKKVDYDKYMNSLSADYSDVKELWTKVSGQIDSLYKEIQTNGAKQTGTALDTGLYTQYFEAFDKACDNIS